MLAFAVWAVLYGLSYSVSKLLFPTALPYITPCYAVLLISWLGYRQRLRAFRLCLPVLRGWSGVLVMLLLLLLPAANLLSGGSFASGKTAVLMLGPVIVEEIFFRGVLLAEPGTAGIPFLAWMTEQPVFVKAIISSGLFAVCHAANVTGGEEWIKVVPQITCAFCAGMLFAAVTFRTNSLIPAAAGHFLVNVTASESNVFSVLIAAGSVICLAAGISLLRPAGHLREGNCS